MKPIDLGRTLAVMLIWGFNFPIAKTGLGEFPPILMMALRFALVALLVCPVKRLPLDKLAHILVLSMMLGSVHFSLMFTGLSRIDAATASLLTPVQVPISALLAALVLRERLSLRLWLGLAIAFLGVVLIAGEPRFRDVPAIFLIVAASTAWAIGNIQLKYVGTVDPFALSGWIAFFAAPQLLLVSLALEPVEWSVIAGASWRGWGAVVYNAVGVTIVSYSLWYPLMRKYPVSLMMPFTLLAPVIAVGASVLLLGESVTPRILAGGCATMIGVAIIVLRRRSA